MNEDIKVIKFDNGEVVVAIVEESDFTAFNFINILYPIQILTEANVKDDQTVERYSLKPWLGVSDETLYKIRTHNIITMVDLKTEHAHGYTRMVDVFYPNEERLQEIEEENEHIDTIIEYLNAKNNNEVN